MYRNVYYYLMKKWIVNFLCLIVGFIIGYLVFNPTTEEQQEIREVTIRDSIYVINDSIIEKIKYVDRIYEKEVSNIISSSDSVNLSIFSEYIDNYQRTIKDN